LRLQHTRIHPALYTQSMGLTYKTLTPPADTLVTADVKTESKLQEHRGEQLIGEDVDELRSHQNMEGTNVSDGNVLADKVKINLNMFGALMLNGVDGEVDGADVITVDQSDPRQGAVQLHKQLMKPTRLCHVIGHNAVLHLSARTGDGVLTLRVPGDVVVTQEHCVARSGPTSVRTIGPVSISADIEVRRRGTTKKQAVVEGALEVSKDVLHDREMGAHGGHAWRHTCWTT
jgi:hypothetical protein